MRTNIATKTFLQKVLSTGYKIESTPPELSNLAFFISLSSETFILVLLYCIHFRISLVNCAPVSCVAVLCLNSYTGYDSTYPSSVSIHCCLQWTNIVRYYTPKWCRISFDLDNVKLRVVCKSLLSLCKLLLHCCPDNLELTTDYIITTSTCVPLARNIERSETDNWSH